MSIVPSSRAIIRTEPKGLRGTCAFIDDTQGQAESPAGQPATDGHGLEAEVLCGDVGDGHRTDADQPADRGAPGTGFGFIGSRPSRCNFFRASLRARRTASAFSRALFSEGFS
jgi:hypothetical protein